MSTDTLNDEQYQAPCPNCGGRAQVVGGRLVSGMQAIDYIECACGYSGDQFEEDGVLFDIVCNGNEDDYIAQYYRIKSAAFTNLPPRAHVGRSSPLSVCVD